MHVCYMHFFTFTKVSGLESRRKDGRGRIMTVCRVVSKNHSTRSGFRSSATLSLLRHELLLCVVLNNLGKANGRTHRHEDQPFKQRCQGQALFDVVHLKRKKKRTKKRRKETKSRRQTSHNQVRVLHMTLGSWHSLCLFACSVSSCVCTSWHLASGVSTRTRTSRHSPTAALQQPFCGVFVTHTRQVLPTDSTSTLHTRT